MQFTLTIELRDAPDLRSCVFAHGKSVLISSIWTQHRKRSDGHLSTQPVALENFAPDLGQWHAGAHHILTRAITSEVTPMNALLIRTKYDPKPIPVRSYDWDAWIDGHEEAYSTAHGPTQAAAVEELAETVS